MASKDADQEIKSKNKEIISIWKKLGWSRGRPSTRDLADRAGLLELYDFLYAATSRIVHFTPQSLLRMGWCNIPGTDPSTIDDSDKFSYSLSHFTGYHAQFTRFYGARLFLDIYESFRARFPDNETVLSAVSILQSELEGLNRWPEVVTFEEMNIPFEEGIERFMAIKHPLGTILAKGLPSQLRRRPESDD